MRRFEVWRFGARWMASPGGARLCEISVPDSEGPREAAVEYAHERKLLSEAVVHVRGTTLVGAEVTRWRVELVTTYRARPA